MSEEAIGALLNLIVSFLHPLWPGLLDISLVERHIGHAACHVPMLDLARVW